MTAQEAREKTENKVIVKQNFELISIISNISEKVDNGDYYLNLPTPRYWEVNKYKILELGYKIEEFIDIITISW